MTEPNPEYEAEGFSFGGFPEPIANWSKLPHAFIEALPLIDSLAEMKVILYVLRHTWGYEGTRQRRISIDEFEHGRRRKKAGDRIDGGTGMSAPSLRDGIRRAIEHGFIEVEEDASDPARIKRYYRLSMQGERSLPPPERSLPPQEEILPPPENILPPQENNLTPIMERNPLERNPGKKPEKETAEISGDALLDEYFGPRPDRVPQQVAPGANVADPVQAGGADSCADTLVDAVCRFNGLTQGSASLPEKKRVQMVRKANEILQEWGGGTVEQVRLAWQGWTVRCGWHKQADLFYESFANEFGMLLLAVRDGTVTVEILRKEVEDADAKAKQNGGNGRGGGDRRPQRRERGRYTAEDAARVNAQAAAELAKEAAGG